MLSLHRTALIAVALALLTVGEAFAQSDEVPLIEIIPAVPDAEPEQTSPSVAPSPVIRDIAAPPSAPPEPVILPLRPMTAQGADMGIIRLQGERDAAEFRLSAPAVGGPAEFIITYRTAIDSLPEQSLIRVIVNGEPVAEFEPRSFSGFTRISVGAANIEEGENLVRIEAYHHHRVFCGTDVSFALWTEIDLQQSGILLANAGLSPEPSAFLAAIAAQAARRLPIEVRSSATENTALLGDVATRLTAQLGGTYLPFRRAHPWTPQGSAPALARVSILPAGSSATGFRIGGDGAIVLVLEETTALEELARVLPPVPEHHQVARLEPGQAVPLNELGFADAGSREHYFRRDVDFRLPDDWLVLASQKAELGFLYSYAEGIPAGAILLIKVNGETVRLLPLDRDGGQVQPRLRVQFNARMLRPRVNTITFETLIPGDPPDQTCPIWTDDILTIFGDTTLMVPESPRMQLAGMASALANIDGSRLQTQGAALAQEDALLPLRAMLGSATVVEGEATELTVLGVGDAASIPRGELDLQHHMLANAVNPGQVAPESIDASERSIWDRAKRMLDPGDGPADQWLAQNKGTALLVQPDPATSGLWLLLGPQADAARIASAIVAGRESAGGPSGQLSLLSADGTWTSWTSSAQRPLLLEPLSIGNVRFVLGNYASWSPLLFVGLLMGLAFISAVIALIFVVSTRGPRK